MKKYTYFFTYKGKHGSDEVGSVSLVAANMMVANRFFERLYVNGEDACRGVAYSGIALINGVEINVTNIVETSTIA